MWSDVLVVGGVVVFFGVVALCLFAAPHHGAHHGRRPGYLERGPDCSRLRRWRGVGGR